MQKNARDLQHLLLKTSLVADRIADSSCTTCCLLTLRVEASEPARATLSAKLIKAFVFFGD